MKKRIERYFPLVFLIIFVVVLSSCAKPSGDDQPQASDEQQEQPLCTERTICKDPITKALRKADCTFEQETPCPAGCENGECKPEKTPTATQPSIPPKTAEEKPVVESTKPALNVTKKTPTPTSELCENKWTCFDSSRYGFQSSHCEFSQVKSCPGGCSNGICAPAPPAQESKIVLVLKKQGQKNFDNIGDRYIDFSTDEILEKDVFDQDVKIRLFAQGSMYNFFKVDSPRTNTWALSKPVQDATYDDCLAQIKQATNILELRTGQTLCLRTNEGDYALVGGSWTGLPSEKTILFWRLYGK